jgi:hypothetical protein
MTTPSPALFTGLALVLASCNPYNPDLGFEPFQCGDSEPRCPLGYTCKVYDEGEICQKSDGDLPDGGAGDGDGGSSNFQCNDDTSVEPNDEMLNSFDSGIPDVRTTFALVGLAICPPSDVDLYKFEVTQTGMNVRAEIDVQADGGSLVLDILNMSGTTIASGSAISGTPNTLRAEVPNLASGTYYVKIGSGGAGENNYERIEINTSGP